jgi:hypothetical protein
MPKGGPFQANNVGADAKFAKKIVKDSNRDFKA